MGSFCSEYIDKVVQNMYFNAIFVVGTSGLRLKSTILKGPLLKSGVPPSRSSGELIISGYPAQSALKKFQFLSGLLFPFSIWTFFPFSIWTFFYLFNLDFYFTFFFKFFFISFFFNSFYIQSRSHFGFLPNFLLECCKPD